MSGLSAGQQFKCFLVPDYQRYQNLANTTLSLFKRFCCLKLQMCSANLTADTVNFSKANFSGGRAVLVGFIRRVIWPSENVLLGVFFCFYKEEKIPVTVFSVMFVVLNNNQKLETTRLYHTCTIMN